MPATLAPLARRTTLSPLSPTLVHRPATGRTCTVRLAGVKVQAMSAEQRPLVGVGVLVCKRSADGGVQVLLGKR